MMGKEKKEKTSKNATDKKSKSQTSKKRKNGEKKKLSPDEGSRKYGYISPGSVISVAESAGLVAIHEEVAKSLAEDVSYRLRSIAQHCAKYMKHSKHKQLTCSDVSEVLKMCDIQPVYGHADNPELTKFTYIREAEVYVTQDQLVDLTSFALSKVTVHQKPKITVSGAWQVSDDNKPKSDSIKTKVEETKPCSNDHNKSFKLNHVSNSSMAAVTKSEPDGNSRKLSENHKLPETAENETKISTNLIKYYGITCNTILGHSDLKVVFQDLSQNRKMLPIIPYLLNFITITLNKLGSERQIMRLLQTVEALTENVNIDFTPYLPTSRVVSAVLMIIAIDKKPAKMSYNYGLRRYAAQVLSKVFARWCYRDEQKTTVIKKMGKLLYDVKVSSKVHYGAIVLLTVLGPEALNSFWAISEQYLPYLQVVKSELGVKVVKDVSMLEEVIMSAAEMLYRYPHIQDKDSLPSVAVLDRCLYKYFGDSLCIIRKNVLEDPRYLAMLYKTEPKPSGQETKASEQVKRQSRMLKYMSTRYKPEANRPTIDTVFSLPTICKKRNPRIIFKFAGAIPVPEISLKRKRLDSRYSQFIAGKESEGHVVVVGKFWRKSRFHQTGSIFSIL